MPKKSEIGQIGENLACAYLKSKKYLIIGRNVRKPWGELDIIAKEKDGTLVFIEVKTFYHSSKQAMDGCAELRPEDNLTASKLKKLRRAASLFAGYRNELVKDKQGWRIDLVAINLLLTNLEKDVETYTLRHYENIF
jgi:putative endonuclease